MVKTHLGITSSMGIQSACGRGERMDLSVHYVNCLNCKSKPVFIKAMELHEAAKKAAFQEQTPRMVREPWHEGITYIICRGKSVTGVGEVCGNDHFREADRTCYGHYANYVCDACGHTESRLTETGMSF